MSLELVNPTSWIEQRIADVTPPRPPMIYVAHPVAPRPGECVAECMKCKAQRLYAPSDALDLRLLCDHDAPVTHCSEMGAIVRYNLARAMRWWKWLDQLLGAVWTMPWWVNVSGNGEGNLALVERGLRDDVEIVKRCDALMLCGPRVSKGMRIEAIAARDAGLPVFQIGTPIILGGEPPPHHPGSVPWSVWSP